MNTLIDAVKLGESWPSEGLERVEACPICRSTSRRMELKDLVDKVFGCAPGKWTLFRCLNCGCAYLDPRPDPHTIGLAYRSYYTHAPTGPRSGYRFIRRLREGIANSYRNRLFGTKLEPSIPGGWILAAMARANAHSLRLDGRGLDRVGRCKGKLLDIGCGNGSFLGMAEQAGWECYGVEPDREAESIAAAQGIKILGSHLDELRGRFDSYFEIVTLNHVIEHVHDPTQTLCDCWAMLKPGGFVWLETPNIDSIGYQIYSRSWRGLEPPRHLVLFNRHALSTCLTNAGFNDIHVLPPRDAVSYTFSRSAYVAAGSLAEGNPAPLSTAENIILKTNMRRARRLVCTNPERSEFISAMAYKS